MKRLLLIPLALAALASAQDAKLRGGNTLACETYSFRDMIRAGKLDMTTIPAFYKEQGIKGISYNDMFFKTVDDAFIDQVKAAVKKADRVVRRRVLVTAASSPDVGGQPGAPTDRWRPEHVCLHRDSVFRVWPGLSYARCVKRGADAT
jgi:hypothetical protein